MLNKRQQNVQIKYKPLSIRKQQKGISVIMKKFLKNLKMKIEYPDMGELCKQPSLKCK